MSKKPPELTWQDSAILITIPLVVFGIFVFANYMSQDLTVTEAFQQQLRKVEVRDGGTITGILPPEAAVASAPLVQQCRIRSRDGQTEFTFRFPVTGSETMALAVGRMLQFHGEYQYDPRGGTVEAPFKGKSGRYTGWAVYENRRYFHHEQAGGL